MQTGSTTDNDAQAAGSHDTDSHASRMHASMREWAARSLALQQQYMAAVGLTRFEPPWRGPGTGKSIGFGLQSLYLTMKLWELQKKATVVPGAPGETDFYGIKEFVVHEAYRAEFNQGDFPFRANKAVTKAQLYAASRIFKTAGFVRVWEEGDCVMKLVYDDQLRTSVKIMRKSGSAATRVRMLQNPLTASASFSAVLQPEQQEDSAADSGLQSDHQEDSVADSGLQSDHQEDDIVDAVWKSFLADDQEEEEAPAPSASVEEAPVPSASVEEAPAPSASVEEAPAPSASVEEAPAPSASVKRPTGKAARRTTGKAAQRRSDKAAARSRSITVGDCPVREAMRSWKQKSDELEQKYIAAAGLPGKHKLPWNGVSGKGRTGKVGASLKALYFTMKLWELEKKATVVPAGPDEKSFYGVKEFEVRKECVEEFNQGEFPSYSSKTATVTQMKTASRTMRTAGFAQDECRTRMNDSLKLVYDEAVRLSVMRGYQQNKLKKRSATAASHEDAPAPSAPSASHEDAPAPSSSDLRTPKRRRAEG